MEKKNNMYGDKLTISFKDIPLESNLGLLAFGDLAFEAWRELKTASNIEFGNEEE
ncbi:hypothetical protein M0G43_06995 [Subsaxibacter sp. CAU 1640]|uniref:hypothetical protein n=1 Tax=Subsaxibacter sp. CAU 1640 TaxID=2933271 RepID=UPI002003A71B|nr:hypothetical protein [Subsaxibacter sp. CAU 1640]MCK7590313.1 hypothetical protein [Subsaxibacter sp. CAU 1640]